ncbi:hypothetical protein QFC19_000625 [Naganishia cerealis]|uniref:Uncharacterized protein n=1 Tax=Naganishia cerealis TaxID=610337 RepID=A0ACC2WN52_9TREE|nr:hypothetical protein QFC19_000625 [Naganishia cerealis]
MVLWDAGVIGGLLLPRIPDDVLALPLLPPGPGGRRSAHIPPDPAPSAAPAESETTAADGLEPWNKVLPPSPPSKRKSIRLVGPCGDGDDQSGITGTRLFTPLPLEIDFSPFDVEFRKLVIDVPADEDEEEEEQRLSLLGSRKEEEFRQRQGQDRSIKGKEMEDSSWDPNGACRTLRPFQQQPRMPSRPKLVHFATTPSFSRRLPEGGADKQTEYDADDALGKGDVKTRSKKRVSSSPVNEQLASNRASRSSYTSDNYRLFTPIRNLSHSPPPPSPPPSASGVRIKRHCPNEMRILFVPSRFCGGISLNDDIKYILPIRKELMKASADRKGADGIEE